MSIFSFGGASSTLLKRRLTKGTLSCSILTTVNSYKRVLYVLG